MAQSRVTMLEERKRILIDRASEHRAHIAASFRELETPLAWAEAGLALVAASRGGIGAALTMGAMAMGRKVPIAVRSAATLAKAGAAVFAGVKKLAGKLFGRKKKQADPA